MEEPNCHTPMITMTSRAVLGFPKRDIFCWIPKSSRRDITTPLLPKSCFQTMDTAMLPPMIEGT